MIGVPEIGLGAANLLKPSLSEFIEIAARHGFRRITVRPHVFAEALRDLTEAELRRHLSDAGVEVTMIDALNNGLPGVPNPDALSPATRAIMPPDVLQPRDEACCLHAASVLGAGLLNVVAYQGTVVPIDQMAEAISGICRRAARYGVKVALEFLPDSGIPDLHHAITLIQACGEANCGLTLDVFHFDRSGGAAADLDGLPPGAIFNFQLSDRLRGAVAHVPFGGRRLPGDGELPLFELTAATLSNSPDTTIDIEVLNVQLSAMRWDKAASMLAITTGVWRNSYEQGQPPGTS